MEDREVYYEIAVERVTANLIDSNNDCLTVYVDNQGVEITGRSNISVPQMQQFFRAVANSCGRKTRRLGY